MAQFVGTPILGAAKLPSSNTYELTVTYTVRFSNFEKNNFKFKDGFVVWEDDPIFNDKLTGLVASSVFDPATNQVTRTLKYKISGGVLDTEWGKEEIYAVVHLRNIDLNLSYSRTSTTLPLAP